MSDKKTIVIVAHDVGGQGGMERHLEEVIMRLKLEAKVIVVAASMKLPDAEGVRFIRIPVIARPVPLKMLLFAVLATLRLWFVKRDVLHTTGAIVWNRADVSTVHFCHAGYMKATGGTRSKLNRSLLRSLNSTLATRFALWMERIVYKPERTKKLVAVSKRVRSELLGAFPYSPEDVIVVPNGVNVKRFRPYSQEEKRAMRGRYDLPEQGTFLLFMGGDWPLKGLEYLVKAFDEIAGEFPGLHLAVVGKGDKEQFLPFLSVHSSERVFFAGKQPKPEEWFGLADMFVSLSSYETFSLVVHEAAAAGLLILSTKVGGVEDLIEDSVNGIITQRNHEGLVWQLRTVLSNIENYLVFGENARLRVRSLTWDHTYKLMRRLYSRTEADYYGSRGVDIERNHA